MKINSKQEAFDFAVRHMFKQGEKSMGQFPDYCAPSCAYRGDSGKMCIVGAMIDDAHYDSEIEENDASDDRVREALTKSGVNLDALVLDSESYDTYYDPEHAFLLDLQDCHDGWNERLGMSDLYYRFKDFATNWNLNMNVFEELNWKPENAN